MTTFRKFYPLFKVDDQAHRIFGPVMSEVVDSDREIADFDQHKGAYQRWSDKALKKTTAAGQDPSLGNIRIQHDEKKLGGKATAVVQDDAEKTIRLETEPVNDEVWKMLKGGFLTGYSQAGTYIWRKCDSCGSELPRRVGANYCGKCKRDVIVRYGSELSEVSYVDVPANPDASFQYVRADGQIEMRKFARTTANSLSEQDVDKIVKALKESLEAKATRYLVPASGDDKEDHLPVTDESGNPSHRLMGAAWAALHGGYRGNKYEGPGKEKAIERLKAMYRSEGMETPSDKAVKLIGDLSIKTDHPDIWEAIFDQGSELDTQLEKFSRIVTDLMKDTATVEGDKMTPEQMKKCADALGISVEEFQKQFVEGDALAKGAKGLAALGAHLKKAIAHHDKMSAHHDKMHKAHQAMAGMHKEHADHHATMADHLENCHKAHGACTDGDEADKVLKALLADLKVEDKTEKTEDKPATGLTAEDLKKALDDQRKEMEAAFDKKLESTVAPMSKEGVVRLRPIGRDGKEIDSAAVAAGDPFGGN